jgi:magnesium transporter
VGASAGDLVANVQLCIDNDGKICTSQYSTIPTRIDSNIRLTWLDVYRSDKETILDLGRNLQLHELSIEDAMKGGQRPKIDSYGNDQTFIVFYAIAMSNGAPEIHELSIFVGQNFIITVHDMPVPLFETIAKRWNSVNQVDQEKGRGMLLYAILDGLVDDYFPVLDEIGEELDRLETLAFELSERETRTRIFDLRRELLQLRRIVSAERDVVNALLRHDLPMFTRDVSIYMTDVYDHLLRSYDWLDSYRDQLATLLDLQNTAVANRMNQIMKTLTASSIMLMTASLVAGIYGMNFENMPELGWRYGYFAALILMFSLIIGLYVTFLRRDWL